MTSFGIRVALLVDAVTGGHKVMATGAPNDSSNMLGLHRRFELVSFRAVTLLYVEARAYVLIS